MSAFTLTPPPMMSSPTLYTSGFGVVVFASCMFAFRIARKVVFSRSLSSRRSERHPCSVATICL